MAEPVDEARARNRWLVLSLSRLLAAGLVIIGLLILGDNLALPEAAGWVLLATGLLGTFVLPQVLVRRWRSRRG